MNFIDKVAQATNNTEIKIETKDLNLSGAPTEVGDSQLAAILGTVYLIAGIVAVVAIIVGGIRYAASNGDSSGVQSAKNTILYAVVGLIVVIIAASITGFIINNIG